MTRLQSLAALICTLYGTSGITQVKSSLSSSVYPVKDMVNTGAYPELVSEFDNPVIRTNQVFFRNREQLFINYRKADTLTFDAPLYSSSTGDTYILEGLAFYKWKHNRYELQFANDYAFFCTSCNNMQHQTLSFSGDTLSLSIFWGPSVASVSDHYRFIWRNTQQKWVLHTAYYPWTNDAGEASHTLLLHTGQPYTLLDTFNAEATPFRHVKGLSQFSLDYSQGDIAGLENALRNFPSAGKKHLPLLFTENDMYVFLALLEDRMQTEDIITGNTVAGLNNIAYYLEQGNSTQAAALLLEKIIAVFPEREVAHLNLGDVYTKQQRPEQAKKQYILYLQQMRKRGLEHKVPQRVTTALNIP